MIEKAICCDGCGVTGYRWHIRGGSATYVREHLHKKGWREWGGNDYCPKCEMTQENSPCAKMYERHEMISKFNGEF